MMKIFLFRTICVTKYASLVLVIFLYGSKVHAHSVSEDADLSRRWQASMDAAEKSRIDAIKPNPFITGSHYVDSAYRIGFYFSPGDSIINKSAGGAALIIITHGFYYARISTVSNGLAAKTYATMQHDEAKVRTPAGITNYKVGKLQKGENEYCFCYNYRIKYTDKDGNPMITAIRLQSGWNSNLVKLIATFPDDSEAAQKETKMNDLANSITAW